jgi:hypothetical protein
MKTTIFEFLAELERDLAGFYNRLKGLSRFDRSAEIFDFMKDHSEGHSRQIERLNRKHEKPSLDRGFFLQVHEQIKGSLFNEINSAEDFIEALQKVSKAEELVGKLYKILAAHYRDLSAYYRDIASEIDVIAEEEFVHRDMVLRESRKY